MVVTTWVGMFLLTATGVPVYPSSRLPAIFCHWQKLPQVSFFSQQKFCRDKSMLAMTKLLSQKIYVCHNKMFVATTYFCHDKRCVLLWQTCVCRDKNKLVVTKLFLLRQVLLRQAYFCCDKRCVLSRQTRVCCDKAFVVTKMILVAAPANDNIQLCHS